MTRRSRLLVAAVLLVVSTVSCAQPPSAATVAGTVVAAPTCPAEPATGASFDPACNPAPVEDAQLVVVADDGERVASTRSDAQGRFAVEVPAGSYRLEPQPLAAYPTTPDPVEFTVNAGIDTTLDTIVYDTGIR